MEGRHATTPLDLSSNDLSSSAAEVRSSKDTRTECESGGQEKPEEQKRPVFGSRISEKFASICTLSLWQLDHSTEQCSKLPSLSQVPPNLPSRFRAPRKRLGTFRAPLLLQPLSCCRALACLCFRADMLGFCCGPARAARVSSMLQTPTSADLPRSFRVVWMTPRLP